MSVGFHQQIRVLHVDDDPSITDLTATFLERDDDRFAVETATSADEGMEKIDNRPPDCIVSDYNMPGTDGIEFLQAVREQYPDRPFILYTGKGSETVASAAIAADVTDYLQKGSGSEQYELLANRIRNAVRARRETQRANRQEQLMRLTEFAGDIGGFELDTETGEVLLTDGACQILHTSTQASHSFEDTLQNFYPDDREDIKQTIQQVLDTGEQTRDTWRYKHPDGDQQLLDITYTPTAADGDTTTIRGAIHNITDRRERQRELRLLQQAIDDANVPITLADPSQSGEPLVYVNDAFEEMTGYPPEETLGRNCRFLQGPDTDPEKAAALREAIDNEEPISIELCNYRKNGTKFWNRLTVTPIYDDNGDLVRYLGTQEDVTERNKRERQLTELNQASQDLLGAETQQEIADIGVRAAREILDLRANAIHLSTADDTQLTPVAQTDELASLLGDMHPLPVADSIAGRVYQHGEPTVIEDVQADSDVHNPETDLRGHVYLPLADHGILIAGSRDRAAFDQHDIALGELLAGNLVAALDRVAHEQTARQRQQKPTGFFQESERQGIVQAVDRMDSLFCVIETDGTLRDWNKKIAEVTGYSESELDGMAAIELFSEDERETVSNSIEATLTDGGARVNADLLTADGRRIPHELSGGRLTDEEGNTTGLVGIGQNATDRKERKYRELAEEYEALLETSGDAIFMLDVETAGTDPAFEFARLSPGYETQTGISTEDVRGKTPEAVFGDQRGGELKANYTRCVEQREPISYRETLDIADDARVWETGLAPVIIDEEVIRIVGIARNVTAQVERERELRQQNKRLEEFTSIVSHDLRNPLRVADRRLELIREECESEHIDDVAQAHDRMDALIEDMLTLARKGEQVDETKPVGLANVAKSSWQTVNTEQATLEANISLAVKAEQSRLRQLFENLYRNAVEHGGDDVTVAVGAMDNGFYVADTGPGIPESDRETVFAAGYSTSEKGTGFGLRIVEQVADAHGWAVIVTESEQGGARFEFTGVERVQG